MYTILYRNKELSITKVSAPIYKNDSRADNLRFIVDPIYDDKNIMYFSMLVQIILPDGTSGKLDFLTFEEELYNDKYPVAYMPITSSLTQCVGDIGLSLCLIYNHPDTGSYHIMHTNTITIPILNSLTQTLSPLPPEEDTDVLTRIEYDLNEIKKTKLQNIVYDDTTRTIKFYSDPEHENEISSITLSDSVNWTLMKDVN